MILIEFFKLKGIARDAAYDYFDRHIRPLQKLPSGKVDIHAFGLEDNDADAFRHACVSGAYAQLYGETAANIAGELVELEPTAAYSNANRPESKNMDLWNNSVGRKYGKKTKNRDELLRALHEALKKGELITDPDDPRKYEGAQVTPKGPRKPVVAVAKGKSGRNEIFFDTIKKTIFAREEFISKIQAGEYPGYTVKNIRGTLSPVSKRDSRRTNNLS